MDTDKIKIYGARVRVDSMAKVGEIEAAEKKKMEDKCARIANHGCNLFINRQLIYNYPEQVLMNKGVTSIEHADFDDHSFEALAIVAAGLRLLKPSYLEASVAQHDWADEHEHAWREEDFAEDSPARIVVRSAARVSDGGSRAGPPQHGPWGAAQGIK